MDVRSRSVHYTLDTSLLDGFLWEIIWKKGTVSINMHSYSIFSLFLCLYIPCRAVKFYTTHKKIFDAANFVATLPFKFKSEKCEQLLNSMDDSPNEDFYFDMRSMDWKSYHHDFYFGIRKFILKEHNLDSVKGKKKIAR